MWSGLPTGVNPWTYLLLLVRSGRVTDWDSLAHEFGFNPAYSDTLSYILLEKLEQMHRAGLIILEPKPNRDGYRSEAPERIAINDRWREIQLALDLSLTELTKLGPSALVVNPYFGKPEVAAAVDLFVVMPFDPELEPVYQDHIVGAANELGLSVARGDDSFTAHSVMADIWNSLVSSRAVIADCTGRNPNVFYEIGLAHTMGKPVVLITRSDDDVPFDIRHLRYIQYDFTPRGMKVFEKRLVDTLKTEVSLDTQPPEVTLSVLFIVADESDESNGQLGSDFRAIQAALDNQTRASALAWSQHFLPELRDALAEREPKPRLIHITGHPDGPDELLTASTTGVGRPDSTTLADELAEVAAGVECVVLNGCFAQDQATAISTRIPYTIGIHADVTHRATGFIVDFYRSLSAGRSITEAHEIGCNRARLDGIPDSRLPILLQKV